MRMTEKEYRKALSAMKRAGKEMAEERNGEFSFGEWAGESEREMIESITGYDMDDYTLDQQDELCEVFLGR
jgi:hypothetical protein